MGEAITDLQAFAAFAQRNAEDAFRLFKSPAFSEMLEKEDHRLRAMWRGLMKPPVTLVSMEEFLVGAGLKNPVTVRAVEEGASYEGVRDSLQDVIRLRRDGMGSFALYASCDCDFIELPRRKITDEDFVASSCDFEYRILIGKLGDGIRSGTITLVAPGNTIIFRVKASRRQAGEAGEGALLSRNTLRIMSERLDYMLEKSSRASYVSRSLDAIEERYALTSMNLTLLRLYHAYLERLNGNAAAASVILREFRQQAFSDDEQEEEMAYLYLSSLLGESAMTPEETAERIRSRFDAGSGGYVMLKLLFLTSPDIGRYPRRRKKAAEEVFARGVRSPLLYAEVLRDFRQDDALVTTLNDFTVCTLLFAARRGLLTEKLALRTAYLSANEKFFSNALLKILTHAYENWPLDSILEAIVRVLMKGQPRDGRCFPWYERAVEKGLKVLRLYEYYIETLPETKKTVLPLAVRKFFVMSPSSVSEESRAAIYDNIVRNRQTDPETYAAVTGKAKAFAEDALRRGKTGIHYAALYREYIRALPDEASEKHFSEVLFAERLFVEDPAVRSVTVIHDGLIPEEIVPVVRGVCCIHRYTEDAQLFFDSAPYGRYFTGAAYNLTPLMDRSFGMSLPDAARSGAGFLLARMRAMEESGILNEDDFRAARKAADSPAFSDTLRRDARASILRYLEAHPESSFFHHGTGEETLNLYAEADKAKMVNILLEAGLYKETYAVLLRYGTEGIDPAKLVPIASRMIDEAGDVKDEELASFAMRVLRDGKYDERMLAYLAAFGEGEMDEMLTLRRAADAFYIDTFPLDERILEKAVKEKQDIEEGPEILGGYAAHGGRRALVRAYLEFYADRSAMLGRDVKKPAAEVISEIYDRGEPVDLAMKLTLLKYRSQQGEMTAHEELQVDELLEECMKRGIRLAFMQQLPESFVRAMGLTDRIIIEGRADPKEELLVRYRLISGLMGEEAEEKTEAMTHRFRGIFTKEFLLFYGETLVYTIFTRHGGSEQEIESRTLSAGDVRTHGVSSYARINRMLRAAKEGKDGALREELTSYLKAIKTAESLFELEGTF